MTPCRASRKDGQPCGATLGLSDGLCIHHDPKRADQARTNRRAKPAARPPLTTVTMEELPTDLTSVEACNRAAEQVYRLVMTGRIAPQVAKEATAALREKRIALTIEHETKKKLKEIQKTLAEQGRP